MKKSESKLHNKVKSGIKRFRKSLILEDNSFIKNKLKDGELSEIFEKTPHKHVSVYTPENTLKAFLSQVLSDNGSCRQAVINVLMGLVSEGKESISINTGAYCKARSRLSLEAIINAVKGSGSRLHTGQPEAWKWKGFNLVAADGTTALMADTQANQEVFPQQSNQLPGVGFPILRLVALISLATGSIMDYSYGAYQGKSTGETSLFSKIIHSLTKGDLFIGDCYYCTFAIIAILTKAGVKVLFPQHANRKTDFSKGERLSAKDHIVKWKKPPGKPVRMTREEYDELPDTLVVREFEVKGRIYLTTLLEHGLYKKKELAILYKERWYIELDFRSIKINMGMDMLRCKTPEMVKKEIAVNFPAYNIVRCNIAEAGILHKKQPRNISFMAAVHILTVATIHIARLVGKKLAKIIKAILKAIAETTIGEQKRKNQPRERKRRPKPYKLMTQPRH